MRIRAGRRLIQPADMRMHWILQPAIIHWLCVASCFLRNQLWKAMEERWGGNAVPRLPLDPWLRLLSPATGRHPTRETLEGLACRVG